VDHPRDAEHTVLHQVVAAHLEAFLAAVAEGRRRRGPAAVRGAGVPGVPDVRCVGCLPVKTPSTRRPACRQAAASSSRGQWRGPSVQGFGVLHRGHRQQLESDQRQSAGVPEQRQQPGRRPVWRHAVRRSPTRAVT